MILETWKICMEDGVRAMKTMEGDTEEQLEYALAKAMFLLTILRGMKEEK